MARNDQLPDSAVALREANERLAAGDPEAFAYFETALARTRAAEDRRRELILLLNFLPLLRTRTTPDRAVSLAQRAVELAGRGSLGHQLLAQLRLGEVYHFLAHEKTLAREAFHRALEILDEAAAEDAQNGRTLVEELHPALIDATRCALDLSDTEMALRFMKWADPAEAAKLERLRPVQPPAVTIEELQRSSNASLDEVICAWRCTVAVPGGRARPEVMQRMREFASAVKWTEAVDHLSRLAPTFALQPASLDGAGGLLLLAEQLAGGQMPWPDARAVSAELQITDEDLACVCLYALSDRELFDRGMGSALLALAAERAAGAALAGRLHRLDGMFAMARGDVRHAVDVYRRGAARLADGSNDALRAELLNEAALGLGQMGKLEEALEVIQNAGVLARSAGAPSLAFMTEGNRGVFLMNLRRNEEALAVFTALKRDQLAVNDTTGASQTEFNLAACRQNLGFADANFSAQSDDPDTVVASAVTLAGRGAYAEAIPLFERAISLADRAGVHWPNRAQSQERFARTLFSAHDLPRAIEQMRAAAAEFSRAGNRRGLQGAQSWLATVTSIPAAAEKHAEFSLAAARAEGSPELLADALISTGIAKVRAGEIAAAIEALEEAYETLPDNRVRNPLAETLVMAGQPARARALYVEMLAVGEKERDAKVRLIATLGLATCSAALHRMDEAVAHLRSAHAIAAAGNVEEPLRLETLNRLGITLVMRGQLAEGMDLLEAGIASARAGGHAVNERHLLLNFANALKELGDAEGARRALLQVREQSRDSADTGQEARAVYALANLDQQARRLEAARSGYLEAVALARQVQDWELLGAALDSAGATESLLGQPALAIAYHREALDAHGRANARKAEAIDGINLAQAYTLVGDGSAARMILDRTRQLIDEHGLAHLIGSVELAAGRFEARFGSWPAAVGHFRQAIDALETERQSIGSPLQQREWSDQRTPLYSIPADAAIDAGDGPTAIEFLEGNRARFLQSLVARRHGRPLDTAAQWLAYDRAADRVAALRWERRHRLARGETAEPDMLRRAQADLAGLAASLPSEAVTTTARPPTDWSTLQEAVPPGAAALWFHASDDGVRFVLAGRDEQGAAWTRTGCETVFTTDDLHNLVIGDVERLQRAVQQKEKISAEMLSWIVGSMVPEFGPLWTKVVRRTCRILGERLWPPLLRHLPAGLRELILLPGAGFNVLPLHVALLPDGSRLGDRYEVRYAPSLGLLLDAARKPKDPPTTRRLGQAVNPTEDDRLPFSLAEAHEVNAGFAGERLGPLNGRRARTDAVLDLLQRVDVLHFAGHGCYDTQDPLRSGILCAAPRGDAHAKGELLSLAAILDSTTGPHCRMAVLSACDTGRTEATDLRNDYLGLPGGLLASGVDTVLSSLWRVDDLATAFLIGRFFQTWQPGAVSACTALADAQRWMRTELTVKNVIARLEHWHKHDAADSTVLERQIVRWRRRPAAEIAFAGEEFWGAFCITGLADPWR